MGEATFKTVLNQQYRRPPLFVEAAQSPDQFIAGDGVERALEVAREFSQEAAAALTPLEGTFAAASLGAATDHLIAKVAAAASR